jgi:hypothetical protein
VDDGAHVGLVQTHAERNRGHDDAQPALHELVLRSATRLGRKTRVVRSRRVTVALQADKGQDASNQPP